MDQSSRETVRMDMLHGSLLNKILLFALPLAASSILQQLFNSVDVAVVGKFASSQALAAVGSNGSVISLMINLFVGISVGASVVIANYIGQKNQRGIKNAIHTVSVVTLTSGILLLAIGLFSARPILEMMDTPDDVLDLAVLYLRIYFLGMPFFMIYNFGAAILRSMGDTKRPLYCLVIAGLINTALNLLLVIVFKMSVAGVAIATVVSNMFCAGMVIYILLHEQEPFRLEIKDIKISRPELRKMLQIGIPAGVQGMVFSIANVFIQAATNRFGSNAIAGSAAALTYEYYCYFVVNAFSQAAVTFISQNYGAGQIERCKKVFRQTMLLSVISCALLNGLFDRHLHLQPRGIPVCRHPHGDCPVDTKHRLFLRDCRGGSPGIGVFHAPCHTHGIRHLRVAPILGLRHLSPLTQLPSPNGHLSHLVDRHGYGCPHRLPRRAEETFPASRNQDFVKKGG